MNIELARKIQQKLREAPSQFFMEGWFTNGANFAGSKVENCGTACCIAGWAVALTLDENPSKLYPMQFTDSIWAKGYELLEIGHSTAEGLFLARNWPEQYRSQIPLLYLRVRNANKENNKEELNRIQAEYAELGAQVLEHYIQRAEKGEVL